MESKWRYKKEMLELAIKAMMVSPHGTSIMDCYRDIEEIMRENTDTGKSTSKIAGQKEKS